MSDLFDWDESEEEVIKSQGICNNFDWCDHKVCIGKGEFVCVFEFDACEYLSKRKSE